MNKTIEQRLKEAKAQQLEELLCELSELQEDIATLKCELSEM